MPSVTQSRLRPIAEVGCPGSRTPSGSTSMDASRGSSEQAPARPAFQHLPTQRVLELGQVVLDRFEPLEKVHAREVYIHVERRELPTILCHHLPLGMAR